MRAPLRRSGTLVRLDHTLVGIEGQGYRSKFEATEGILVAS